MIDRTRAAAIAGAILMTILICAPRALASGNVVAKPPSSAERHGLLRAFHRLHAGRSNLQLVGFRLDTASSAAAYYVILGPGGSYYASGHTELYHRARGHSWVHVAHFKNTSHYWNDVDGLQPGFLWEPVLGGSGTWNSQVTSAATDGSWTANTLTNATFTWNMTFGNGLLLGEGHSYNAKPALVGQMSGASTTTYPDAPTDSASCRGPINESNGVQPPDLSYATYPESGKTQALDFTIELTGAMNWPYASCDHDTFSFPEDTRFVLGARIPAAIAFKNGLFNPHDTLSANTPVLTYGQTFSYPVNNSAPNVVSDSNPTQSSDYNDGSTDTTSHETLNLAGTLQFKLVGLWMPRGWLSTPSPPVRADGHVPPVL